MKSSTEDEVEGKLRKAKGEIKETVGKVSDKPDVEAEGSVEKLEGEAKEKKGQIKKVFGK
ncbi:CsbD family protein [Methanosarcina sp. MSH10X1]|uniref:CsbD family protein n=1 Tax=Methanosarcina sp. MSH10X1 TaxID=2507075 RepID=UPI000FFB800D|nr:CsbD family protein [Methanosarcina sp. MSH10X1]RXA21776.1 CsbD family protein [Methanosarcina sp. MSH10X1]